METFTHPDDWQLTECLTCTVQAHYRFNYTLDKNNYGEPTCRACYWRKWAANARAMQGAWANLEPVSYDVTPIGDSEARFVVADVPGFGVKRMARFQYTAGGKPDT